MEHVINIRIERLPEGVYLAVSDDIQGLVAQGGAAAEAMEIARDTARKPLEAQGGLPSTELRPLGDRLDCALIIGT